MRYLLQLALVGISFMVVSGCPPAPPVQPGPAPAPTPTPEPAMATCAEACDNLKTLGCPEGLSLDCVPTCEASSGQLSYHLDCLASAGDAAAAQAWDLSIAIHRERRSSQHLRAPQPVLR